MKEVKDFIYLDMNKVSSLYSQISGGIVNSFETSSSSSDNRSNIRSYDFKIFQHEAGGTGSESRGLTERRVSHHEVINELERELFEQGYTVEIGVHVTQDDIESGLATSIFKKALCVKAEGKIVLEDYERITRIANNYDDVAEFLNKCIESNLKDTPELKGIFESLDRMREEAKPMKNGSPKNKKKKEIEALQDQLNSLISDEFVGAVDGWIIEGLKTWVRVFLPSVFNVRLYPFADMPNFHVMSNVKREFFLDPDTESVHYLFGSKPTINVSILGVITSIPEKHSAGFDPMAEFEGNQSEEEGKEGLSVERGFRGLFRGFDGLEEMIRTCRYPRIMVHPIAIYRAVEPNSALKIASSR